MSAIVIVAHAPLASALKACAVHVWNTCPAVLEAVDVLPDADVPATQAQLASMIAKLKQADAQHQVLILTDVFGATPCNIAQALAAPDVRVLAGVNLPMLMRTVCYASEPIEQLVQRAMAGATQGVMSLAYTAPQQQPVKPGNDSTRDHHQQ